MYGEEQVIKPTRHPNRLIPSDPDMVSLCAAVATNYNKLVQSYERIKHEPLLISNDMESTVQRVMVLVARYEQDDFRHCESDKKALRALAQWTINVNCDIRNQEPRILSWVD